MKKNMLYTVAAIVALAVIFKSCNNDDSNGPAAETLSINEPTTTTLNVYGTSNPNTLLLSVTPAGAQLIWESSNNNIATVSQAGLVTAQNAGTVTITAFNSQNHAIFDYIALTVTRGANPTWGEISFLTDTEWTLSEGGVTQIWSDVVMVANAVEPAEWNAEVPSVARNTEGFGNLFNWHAVNQFGSSFCPYPWRVPSAPDFVALDILLGGDGAGHNPSTDEHIDVFFSDWGAAFSGTINSEGVLSGQSVTRDGSAFYWSNTIGTGPNLAFGLQITRGSGFAGQWADAPNEDQRFIPAAEGGSATLAGCVAPLFLFGSWQGPEVGWRCAVIQHTLVTIPNVHVSQNSGYAVRCVR